MGSILSMYPDKPDDWLRRSVEKNLKLKKWSLGGMGEDLEVMRRELEEELYEEEEEREGGEEEEEEEEEEERKDEDGDGDGDEDEPGDSAGGGAHDGDDGGDAAGGGGEGGRGSAHASEGTATVRSVGPTEPLGGLSSVLLTLRPYAERSASSSSASSAVNPVLAILLSLLFRLLSVLSPASAVARAEDAWSADEPGRAAEAERAAEAAAVLEAEEDDALRGTHLWCPNSSMWVARGDTYAPEDPGGGGEKSPMPMTVRYAGGGRWERWSKNLTTRTRRSATGEPMTRGTWVPVRAGEGWSTAPGKAEVDTERVADGDVRFLCCLERDDGPSGGGGGGGKRGPKKRPSDVIDVTAWATSALLTLESARALGAIDSGRVLFRLDVGSAGAGKGEGEGAWVDERYGGDGGRRGGGGMSRADKKARKRNYGR